MFKISFSSQKFQRVIARIFLPFFIVWCVTIPRQAYAIAIPPAVGAFVGTVASSAVVIGGLAYMAAAGYSMGFVLFGKLMCATSDPSTCAPTGGTVSIPVSLATSGGAPVYPLPPPPDTIPAHTEWQGAGGVWYDSFCGALGSRYPYTWTPATQPSVVITYAMQSCSGSSGVLTITPNAAGLAAGYGASSGTVTAPNGMSTRTAPISCPTGSTLSGTTCAINDPRSYAPDGRIDYAVDGAGNLSQLPENSSDLANIQGINFVKDANGNYVLTGVTSGGQPQITSVNYGGGSGIVQITTQTQNTSATGTTVTSNTTSINFSTGTVISQSGGSQTGSISTGTGTNTNGGTSPSGTATNGAGANITGAVGSNAGTGTEVTNMPTDYARTGEADAAAGRIVGAIGTFTTPTGYGDPLAAIDQRTSAIATAGNSTPSINWTPSLLPGTSTACVAMPIDGAVHGGLLNGITGTASFDICNKLDLVRQILGYAFMVGTAMFVYRRFTRSNSTAEG
jgi:hypothetical protein